jgi:hypothetical protein
MEHDEIKRKDWQLLTAQLLINNHTILKVLLRNQVLILSKLNEKSEDEIEKETHELIDRLYQGTIDDIRQHIPDYPIVETPYNFGIKPKP